MDKRSLATRVAVATLLMGATLGLASWLLGGNFTATKAVVSQQPFSYYNNLDTGAHDVSNGSAFVEENLTIWNGDSNINMNLTELEMTSVLTDAGCTDDAGDIVDEAWAFQSSGGSRNDVGKGEVVTLTPGENYVWHNFTITKLACPANLTTNITIDEA